MMVSRSVIQNSLKNNQKTKRNRATRTQTIILREVKGNVVKTVETANNADNNIMNGNNDNTKYAYYKEKQLLKYMSGSVDCVRIPLHQSKTSRIALLNIKKKSMRQTEYL